MRNYTHFFLLFFFFSWLSTFSQTQISGVVIDKNNREPIANAVIIIQGTEVGGFSDDKGKFSLESPTPPPFTLMTIFFEYDTLRYEVKAADIGKEISLAMTASLSNTVIITDTRVSDKQKTSPTTVENLDIIAIKETPAVNFYDGLGHLKGVDLTAASLGFKVINTRGFNSTSPVRSLQIIDWVDNQSPGLNFSLGNFLGASDLDVKGVDIIVGANSALYGPNAFNGVISMTTKDPYVFQGLSFSAKGAERAVGEFALRYARAFKNKKGEDGFAFKVNAFYFRANDWVADNYDASTSSKVGINNPGGYDAVNRYGDENLTDGYNNASSYSGRITAPGLGIYHRTGYNEEDLVDYNTQNFKANAALHYRFGKKELIYGSSYGTGTTVYQGDNRYSLKGIQFFQNKIELKQENKFFIRAYATNENAGKSYDAVFTAFRLNELANNNNDWSRDYRNFWSGGVPSSTPNYYPGGMVARLQKIEGFPSYIPGIPGDQNPYFPQLDAFLTQYQDSLQLWHSYARAYADSRGQKYFAPGTERYQAAFDSITALKTTDGGTRFLDKSALYHVHGEYKFHPAWMDITTGGNFRLYTPVSDGTIFSDTLVVTPNPAGGNDSAYKRITNYEFGAYLGLEKKLIDERLKLNGTLRLDKNQNFQPLLSPALSAVYSASEKDVIRLSFSSAIRNPTLADQYLYYNVGRAILVGNLSGYNDFYSISSLNDFINSQKRDTLEKLSIAAIRPEKVRTVEIGYRTTFFNHLFMDASYYFSRYKDFIGYRLAVDATIDTTINRVTAAQAYRIASNAQDIVTTQGFSVGFNYYFKLYYGISGNYSWNKLDKRGSNDPLIPAFNTPEHKFNLGVSMRDANIKIGKIHLQHWGFSVNYKWIQGFVFEGSPQFTGTVPTYSLLDAQVNKIVPKIHTTFKLGGSNLLNNKQFQVYGGPRVGRLIYFQVVVDLDKL
ncbi:MAG: carboxypeptidase-like regulatory domain-containing protein [Bacteroidia bacterium]